MNNDDQLRQQYQKVLAGSGSKADKVRHLLSAGVGVTAAARLVGCSTGAAQNARDSTKNTAPKHTRKPKAAPHRTPLALGPAKKTGIEVGDTVIVTAGQHSGHARSPYKATVTGFSKDNRVKVKAQFGVKTVNRTSLRPV